MEKTHVIYVEGEINPIQVRSFKQKLRFIHSSTIVVRLYSYGGDIHSMNIMSAFLYTKMKYGQCKIVFDIEYAESAALMLAVNFPRRRVTKKSLGSIHLPVLGKNKNSSELVIKNKKNIAITFFTTHTKLNEAEVVSLNEKRLTASQMLANGIATEMVEKFPS